MDQAFLDSPIYVSEQTRFVGHPNLLATDRERMTGGKAAASSSGTQSFRDQSTVECLDTASVLRTYRKPLRGETWITPLKSERRLLAQVDAIIGLGERALAQVEALAFDPDVPDANRLFAAAFTLGCVDSIRWMNSVVSMLIFAAERTSAEVDAVTEALCLSPNRHLGNVLEPLLAHKLLAVRAAAVHVMGYRGILAETAWHSAIASGEAAVVASALKAMPHKFRADVCRSALLPLYGHDNERILRLALHAGLRLRSRAAYECAVGIAAIDPSRADSLRLTALFGCRADVARVRAVMAGGEALIGVKSAGILGYVDLIPDLFSMLDMAEEGSKLALCAGEAIWTLTGLPCRDLSEVAGAMQFWTDHAHEYESGARYRLGQFLSTNLLQEQLYIGPWSRKSRQQMYSELLAATHCGVPAFSAFDFIGVQRLALQAIDQWFSRNPNERQAIGSML
jgi:hypothetical protein